MDLLQELNAGKGTPVKSDVISTIEEIKERFHGDLLQAFQSDKVMPTKNDVIAAVEEIRSSYETGIGNSVQDLVVLKQMEFFVKETLKIVAPYATSAVAGMSAEQRKNTCNAKLSLRQAPIKYDFSGNAEWDELQAEIAGYEQEIAIAKNKQKAVEDNLVLVGAAKATEEPKMTLSVTLL